MFEIFYMYSPGIYNSTPKENFIHERMTGKRIFCRGRGRMWGEKQVDSKASIAHSTELVDLINNQEKERWGSSFHLFRRAKNNITYMYGRNHLIFATKRLVEYEGMKPKH
jgi:hypothetical protein